MGDLFNTIITRPLAWVFMQLYYIASNYGLAIILFTLLSKVVLLPLAMKGKRGMMDTMRIQPKLKELEVKYKDDKAKYQQEIAKLYQKENVSVTGGCLWSLLPFPILIALYAVIRTPLTNMLGLTVDQVTSLGSALGVLYDKAKPYIEIDIAQAVHSNLELAKSVVSNIISIDFKFLGLNLGNVPKYTKFDIYFFVPVISGGFAYLSAMLSQKFMQMGKQAPPQNAMNKNMLLMSPIISIIIGYSVPVALSLYWIVSSVLTTVQDFFVTNYYNKIFAEKERVEAEKRARREAQRREELEEAKNLDRERQLKEAEKRKAATKYKMSGKPKKKK